MANASVKNSFAILSAFLLVVFVSWGAFATTAHAQDDGGYVDSFGDNGGYVDSYPSDGGYADTYGDNGGYADTYGDNGGYVDTSGDNGGYIDTSGDNGGYVDTSGGNGGYLDTSCASCVEEGGVEYSEQSYPTESGYTESGYSTPSYGYSMPSVFSTPGYGYGYSTPIASAPIVQNVPAAYQQQQQQQQQSAPVVVQPQPNVTTNTCTNYSCNTTTTTNISNSGNTTTNVSNSGNTITTVIPVASAPVTYQAQYTFPQQTYYTQPTYNYQNVSCTISAYPSSVQAGQYTYLSWQSYGATSAILTNYGNVAPNGSLSIQPYGSTNYVLTVYGYNGQTATCNTYITVGNAYPSVTLSQIPYTGFDFGTLGDAMYWTMLALFAVAAGYLLVYYKGGMGTFATAMIPTRKTTTTVAKTQQKTASTSTADGPVVEKRIESPVKTATLESLPAFSNVRPTSDSMTIANHDGAPRIVISRN